MGKDEEILDDIKMFTHNGFVTMRQLEKYIKKENLTEWADVVARHYDTVFRFCYNPYEAAKLKYDEFYEWCQENNYDILEGLTKIPDDKMYWFEAIIKSRNALRMLCDRQRAEKSKKAKEGIPKDGRPKPVRCLNDNRKFPSINKAAEYYNIRRTQDISDCCYGVIGNVRGLSFEFIKNEGE